MFPHPLGLVDPHSSCLSSIIRIGTARSLLVPLGTSTVQQVLAYFGFLAVIVLQAFREVVPARLGVATANGALCYSK